MPRVVHLLRKLDVSRRHHAISWGRKEMPYSRARGVGNSFHPHEYGIDKPEVINWKWPYGP